MLLQYQSHSVIPRLYMPNAVLILNCGLHAESQECERAVKRCPILSHKQASSTNLLQVFRQNLIFRSVLKSCRTKLILVYNGVT